MKKLDIKNCPQSIAILSFQIGLREKFLPWRERQKEREKERESKTERERQRERESKK